MQALDDNDTWNLVQLPARKKVIGCRWFFAVKVNPNGLVARLKALLPYTILGVYAIWDSIISCIY